MKTILLNLGCILISNSDSSNVHFKKKMFLNVVIQYIYILVVASLCHRSLSNWIFGNHIYFPNFEYHMITCISCNMYNVWMVIEVCKVFFIVITKLTKKTYKNCWHLLRSCANMIFLQNYNMEIGSIWFLFRGYADLFNFFLVLGRCLL